MARARTVATTASVSCGGKTHEGHGRTRGQGKTAACAEGVHRLVSEKEGEGDGPLDPFALSYGQTVGCYSRSEKPLTAINSVLPASGTWRGRLHLFAVLNAVHEGG